MRALVLLRGSSSRDTTAEVARFMSLWKAASLGGYGAVEQLLHADPVDGVHGDGKQWVTSDIARLTFNPIYAIDIDPRLAWPHEPIVSEDEWIASDLHVIAEIGPEAFLRTLLHVLKRRWVAGGDGDVAGHAEIDAEALDALLAEQVLRRIGEEPNILGRSTAALDRAGGAEEVIAEIEELESDVHVLRETRALTPDRSYSISAQAQQLVFLYLIDHVLVGGPSESRGDQVTIVWRIPPADSDADPVER
ncbi:hypothetical protein [Actinocorallia sp. A-T 12471]|uniref:hypothetical protein n=1 Tax=Actinocorallia sp. A-T 12471 TaxID=3089813 RepID=UPI0029D31017|nr:hypothetical protein [Actinocorallia sp. A-T 12471]MDX6742611.1 hypothetical protein [Actinocorallia sp. A-T 12471]